jgi:hypothetical protein
MGLLASLTLGPCRDGPGPIGVRYRQPVWDRDGTNPIPDEVLGTRPFGLVGDGAIPIPDRSSMADASSPIPDPYRPTKNA